VVTGEPTSTPVGSGAASTDVPTSVPTQAEQAAIPSIESFFNDFGADDVPVETSQPTITPAVETPAPAVEPPAVETPASAVETAPEAQPFDEITFETAAEPSWDRAQLLERLSPVAEIFQNPAATPSARYDALLDAYPTVLEEIGRTFLEVNPDWLAANAGALPDESKNALLRGLVGPDATVESIKAAQEAAAEKGIFDEVDPDDPMAVRVREMEAQLKAQGEQQRRAYEQARTRIVGQEGERFDTEIMAGMKEHFDKAPWPAGFEPLKQMLMGGIEKQILTNPKAATLYYGARGKLEGAQLTREGKVDPQTLQEARAVVPNLSTTFANMAAQTIARLNSIFQQARMYQESVRGKVNSQTHLPDSSVGDAIAAAQHNPLGVQQAAPSDDPFDWSGL
jgi:hypothetical protein